MPFASDQPMVPAALYPAAKAAAARAALYGAGHGRLSPRNIAGAGSCEKSRGPAQCAFLALRGSAPSREINAVRNAARYRSKSCAAFMELGQRVVRRLIVSAA